jgi:hypothetical protein
MAYGVKYEMVFNNIYVQDPSQALSAYRLRILKKDYTGPTYALKCGVTPIVIETIDNEGNSYTPIIATRATINAIIDDNFDVLEFFNPYEDEFRTTLEIGSYSGSFTSSSTLWAGVYSPVENVNFNVIGIKQISLVFIDGLSRLKNSKYYFSIDDLLGYTATASNTIIEYVSQCLRKTDLTLDIWVNQYYETDTIPSPNIEYISIKKNFFAKQPGEYYTHYEILEMLCRLYGWEIYQQDNHWMIQSYGSVTRESTYIYYVYTYISSHGDTVTGSYPTTITVDATNNFKQTGESLTVTLNRGKNSIKLINPINNVAGILNGFFQSWTFDVPDAFTVFGTPSINKYDANGGLEFTSYATSESSLTNFIFSDPITVKSGDYLNIAWLDNNYANGHPRYRIELSPTDPTVLTQFLTSSATWNATPNILSFFSSVSSTWKNTITVPFDGTLKVYIYEPYWDGTGTLPDFVTSSFLVNLFGTTTQVFNYDAIQTEMVESTAYNSGEDIYTQGPYFMQSVLQNTIANNSTYNDIRGVATSYYIGTLTNNQSLAITDSFGRGEPGSVHLFELAYQDIGIDELQTQYVLDANFKSKGYWINQKFQYDFTGTGDNIYNYLMKYFQWDVKGALQTSKLNRINFEGSDYPFVQNPLILKLK